MDPYISNWALQHLKVWLINVKGINQLSPIIPKHADLYNNIYITIQSSTRPFIQGMKIKPMPKLHRSEIRMQFTASLIWMQSKHPRSSNRAICTSHFVVMERYQYIRSPSFSSERPKTTIIPMISAPRASGAAAIDSHLEWEWSHFQICLKMDVESLLHNDYLSTYLSIPSWSKLR